MKIEKKVDFEELYKKILIEKIFFICDFINDYDFLILFRWCYNFLKIFYFYMTFLIINFFWSLKSKVGSFWSINLYKLLLINHNLLKLYVLFVLNYQFYIFYTEHLNLRRSWKFVLKTNVSTILFLMLFYLKFLIHYLNEINQILHYV